MLPTYYPQSHSQAHSQAHPQDQPTGGKAAPEAGCQWAEVVVPPGVRSGQKVKLTRPP